MPKVNGVEWIQYLKEHAPGIPIVAITAYPDAKMAADLLRKGVKDYLVKPVENEKLLVTPIWTFPSYDSPLYSGEFSNIISPIIFLAI